MFGRDFHAHCSADTVGAVKKIYKYAPDGYKKYK